MYPEPKLWIKNVDEKNVEYFSIKYIKFCLFVNCMYLSLQNIDEIMIFWTLKYCKLFENPRFGKQNNTTARCLGNCDTYVSRRQQKTKTLNKILTFFIFVASYARMYHNCLYSAPWCFFSNDRKRGFSHNLQLFFRSENLVNIILSTLCNDAFIYCPPNKLMIVFPKKSTPIFYIKITDILRSFIFCS